MQRAAVRVCVCEGPSRALLLTRLARSLPPSLPPSLSLSVPSSPLPIHSVCRDNKLGAEGGTALAQALQHVPQLQTLNLGCALATARPARAAWRGGAARTSRARACVCVRRAVTVTATVTPPTPPTAPALAWAAAAARVAVGVFDY